MFYRRVRLIWALILVAGCAVYGRFELDERYGPADPARYDRVPVGDPSVDFWRDVKPVLDSRCVVCHGCYDAPCQLKLGAWEGVARGGSTATVYDGGRLLEAPPTRLFVDAHQASEWRKKGFFAVLNERAPTPEANLAASVLYRSLALKRAHPLPGDAVLPKPFDFSLDRSNSCPRIEQFEAYEREFPHARSAGSPRRTTTASSPTASLSVAPTHVFGLTVTPCMPRIDVGRPSKRRYLTITDSKIVDP